MSFIRSALIRKKYEMANDVKLNGTKARRTRDGDSLNSSWIAFRPSIELCLSFQGGIERKKKSVGKRFTSLFQEKYIQQDPLIEPHVLGNGTKKLTRPKSFRKAKGKVSFALNSKSNRFLFFFVFSLFNFVGRIRYIRFPKLNGKLSCS